jgi:hypothetical protein
MYPEPRHQVFSSQKRLPVGRKAVTVCIAGINQLYKSPKSIIAVSDRKLSWKDMSIDTGWKVQTIHRKWRVMFAGPLSPMVALLDAIKTAAANAEKNSLRPFARLCSRAYRQEREHIIETEILTEYDLESYSEYRALKVTDRDLFEVIAEQIRKQEEGWNLLFLGFDDVDRPHLFVITEYGKIQYCDMEGFAVIGSGAWAAHNALSRFGFNRLLPRGEAAYGLLAAKFAAESAEGVGENTMFMILKANDRLGRTVTGLNSDDIAEIKAEWKKLPNFPHGTPEKIETLLVTSERSHRFKAENPLKGYIKRLASRKSKRVQ